MIQKRDRPHRLRRVELGVSEVWNLRGQLHEVMLQQPGGGGPVILLPLQTSGDEALALLGEVVRDGRRLLGHTDLCHGLEEVVEVPPRRPALSHLDHHATETPDISRTPIARVVDDLRRHPRYGTLDGMRHGLHGPLRTPEVSQLDVAVEVHQHVGTLHVSVHNGRGPRVQVRQALDQFGRVGLDQILLERAEVLHHLRKGSSSHVLEVDVQAVIQVVVPHEGHDARVTYSFADHELVFEGFLELPVVLVVGVKSHLLYGKDLAALLVHRLEDDPQRATANAVPTDPLHGLSAQAAPGHGRGGAHRLREHRLPELGRAPCR
mmetsp:Transcript_22776/g.60151  ORF Transcript_22776/g.60151 Transcript_22776/m.60151 type:complete len:321 (-) Transcript_22776:282-1244(-)